MIQANELRIGNWVRTKSAILKGTSIRYEFDYEKIIIDHFKNFEMVSEAIEPIPLTPEILEKCGFEKSIQGNIDFYEIGDFSIEHWGKLSIEHWGEYCLFTDGNLSTKIYYLHQLQNLYFALTGQELTVNL